MKIWFASLVLGALALCLSCGGSKPPVENKAIASEVKTENYDEAINAAKNDPHNSVAAAFQRAQTAQSFRAKLEATSNGRTSEIKYEYVAPDRYRLVNGPTEMIVIGEQAYIKTMGAWQKVASGGGDQMNSIRGNIVAAQVREATNVSFVQSDTLNGAPTVVYEYTTNSLTGANGTSRNKTWVGLADGLPRKSEFASNFGGFSSTGVMTWYDYNADVKIEPPLK